MSKQTNLSSGCLLPDEPVLCVIVGLLGAPLEDVVVEVGAVAAGDAQDVEGADLLHSCSFPRCIQLSVSVSYVVVSLWSPWSLQRRLMIFARSCCEAHIILLSQLVRVSSPAFCVSLAGLS